MEFLGNLGIDIWLLLAQIVNFLILLWVLKKLVYKPLIARIEADEQSFHAVRQTKSDLEKRALQLERKEKQYHTRTKNRAKAIIAEAEAEARKIAKKK